MAKYGAKGDLAARFPIREGRLLAFHMYSPFSSSASGGTPSRSQTSGSEPENSLLCRLSDETQEPTDAQAMRNLLKEDIEDALNTLEPREREVVRLYFGLGEVTTMTLEEIGVQFRLTRERVRQIKERALAKLRSPKRARRLMPYME